MNIIEVKQLSKKYRIGIKEKISVPLTESILSFITSPLKNLRYLNSLTNFDIDCKNESIITAIDNVTFNVNEGEVLGIIGKNGAGKSTLLKILSRITQPTSGHAVINGRIGSLLEVGTGFHPELTGRENIYLNGTILGMKKKEIENKLDEIIDFSGISRFIDTPIKRYSSGMKVRLAFAVASTLESEILLIDEVLAVGDFEFQQKCLGKMESISKNSGRTIIFVSHNMGAVKNLCKTGLVLNLGKMTFHGDINKAIHKYIETSAFQNSSSLPINLEFTARESKKNAPVILSSFTMINSQNQHSNEFCFGEQLAFEVEVKAIDDIRNFCLIISIETRDGQRIITSASDESEIYFSIEKEYKCKIIAHYTNLILLPGTYNIGITIYKGKMGPVDQIPFVSTLKINEITYGNTKPYKGNLGLLRINPSWKITNYEEIL